MQKIACYNKDNKTKGDKKIMGLQEWTFVFITIALAGIIPTYLAYHFENEGNEKGKNLSLYYAGLFLIAGGLGTITTTLLTFI